MRPKLFSFWFFPCAGLATVAWAAAADPSFGWRILAAGAAAGTLGWTLMEYLLHRFLFHSRSQALKELRTDLHLCHHADPRDTRHLFVRARYSLPISALFFTGLLFSTGSPGWTVSAMCGLWAGFLYYELVHFRVHLGKSSGPFLQAQRRQHFSHHFVDSHSGYGVTSPLWDHLFGSAIRRPSRAESPARRW